MHKAGKKFSFVHYINFLIGILTGFILLSFIFFSFSLLHQVEMKYFSKNQITDTPVPQFSHVFIILMENKSDTTIMNNQQTPYLHSLVNTYGYATNYYAITHPSLPNYLAITGGQTFGITSDCTTCFVNGKNLFQQLEENGKTWKAYLEDMPTNCSLTSDENTYVMRHNPPAYYISLRGSCGKHDVAYTQLATDLQSNTIPNFVWISPNNQHNMHNGTLQEGDNWLQKQVPTILKSQAFQQHGILFIVWDENDDNNVANRVPLLVISSLSKKHYISTTLHNHYSLLKTIEEGFHLSLLGNAQYANDIADFFH